MEQKKPVANPTKERQVLGDVGQSSPSVSTEINAGGQDHVSDDILDKKEKAMAPQPPIKKKKKKNPDMELEEDGNEAVFVQQQKSDFNKACTKFDVPFFYKGERRTPTEALYVHFKDQLGASKIDGAAGFVRGVHNITCAVFLDNNSIPMDENFMQNIFDAEKDDDEQGRVMNYEEFWKWLILEAHIDILALSKYFNELVLDRFDCVVHGTVILKNCFLKCKGHVYSKANAIIANRILDEKYGTNDNIKCFGCLKFQGDGLLYDVTLYKEIEKDKRKYPGLRERKNYAQN